MDPQVIHMQIHDIMFKTVSAFSTHMHNRSLEIGAIQGQLFQHTRWDFMLKDDFTVHLMEVNDSPLISGNKMLERFFGCMMNLTGVNDWKVKGSQNQIYFKMLELVSVSKSF